MDPKNSQEILTASSHDAPDECSICYELLTNKAFASDCLHYFCCKCIRTWVQLRATCPLCLQPITAIITNVRSNDDYDIEQVAPPQANVFTEFIRNVDIFEYESSLGESMSTMFDVDLDDFDEDLGLSDDNLQWMSDASQESLSNSHGNLLGESNDEECSADDVDDLSNQSSPESVNSSYDEEEADKDDESEDEEDDENECSHSESESEEEFHDDNDDDEDEEYDFHESNNEDEYEGDDDDYADNYEDNLSFSDDCYNYDYDSDSYSWSLFSSNSSFLPSPPRDIRESRVSFQLADLLSKVSNIDNSDSDLDYDCRYNTADLVYSSNYY